MVRFVLLDTGLAEPSKGVGQVLYGIISCMSDFKAIILAGGSGERFWPLSTPEKPKQFLSVFGNESLIRQSVSRLKGLVNPQNVFVITSKALVAATRRELPEIPKANIVGEPMRRDTGAAVALGVGVAGDGVLGFFPSDQLVAKPAAFRSVVRQAIKKASVHSSTSNFDFRFPIVTVGITPDYPATQFGYVDPKTGRFVEKPNVRKAKDYLKKGYLWNAGMFIGKSETFRAAFAAYAPELVPVSHVRRFDNSAIRQFYEPLPRISFDYAVMEKLPRVAVVAGDFGWDDVGSHGAFDKHFARGKDGNIVLGDVNAVESTGCTAVAKGAKVALLGVKDLVVVTTNDAVLVVAKDKVAELKKLFAK